jgi:hypothetical protein
MKWKMLLALAVLAASGCLEREAPTAAEEEEGTADTTVETVAAKLLERELLVEPEGQPETRQIDGAYLDKMKEKYPAIYEGVEAGSYEVTFRNLLVIYDPEKDEIKKQYVLKTIEIGG